MPNIPVWLGVVVVVAAVADTTTYIIAAWLLGRRILGLKGEIRALCGRLDEVKGQVDFERALREAAELRQRPVTRRGAG